MALIKDCLKPAHVQSIDIEGRKAIVHVEESQKPLAIGKAASNVKLATEISGYHIEIQ